LDKDLQCPFHLGYDHVEFVYVHQQLANFICVEPLLRTVGKQSSDRESQVKLTFL